MGTMRYTLDERDIDRASGVAQRAFPYSMIRWTFGAVIACALISLFEGEFIWGIFSGIVAGGVIGHTVSWWAWPKKWDEQFAELRRRVRVSRGVAIEEEGLRFEVAEGDYLLRWPYVLQWKESRKYFKVFLGPDAYFVVPKRELSHEAVVALRQALRTGRGE